MSNATQPCPYCGEPMPDSRVPTMCADCFHGDERGGTGSANVVAYVPTPEQIRRACEIIRQAKGELPAMTG